MNYVIIGYNQGLTWKNMDHNSPKLAKKDQKVCKWATEIGYLSWPTFRENDQNGPKQTQKKLYNFEGSVGLLLG